MQIVLEYDDSCRDLLFSKHTIYEFFFNSRFTRAQIVKTIRHTYHVPSPPQYVHVPVPGPTVVKPVGKPRLSVHLSSMSSIEGETQEHTFVIFHVFFSKKAVRTDILLKLLCTSCTFLSISLLCFFEVLHFSEGHMLQVSSASPVK